MKIKCPTAEAKNMKCMASAEEAEKALKNSVSALTATVSFLLFMLLIVSKKRAEKLSFLCKLPIDKIILMYYNRAPKENFRRNTSKQGVDSLKRL